VSCPFCGGGRSKDEAFYITRLNHYALYVCHRATCGKRGRLALGDYVSTVDDIRKVPIRAVDRRTAPRPVAYWQGKYDQACLGEFKRPAYQIGLYANADWPDKQCGYCTIATGSALECRPPRWSRRKVVRSHKETQPAYTTISGPTPIMDMDRRGCLSAAALNSWVAGCSLARNIPARRRARRHNYSPQAVSLSHWTGSGARRGIVKQRLSCYTTRPVHVLYMPRTSRT